MKLPGDPNLIGVLRKCDTHAVLGVLDERHQSVELHANLRRTPAVRNVLENFNQTVRWQVEDVQLIRHFVFQYFPELFKKKFD